MPYLHRTCLFILFHLVGFTPAVSTGGVIVFPSDSPLSTPLSLHLFKTNNTIPAINASPANPPTTPPMIGPLPTLFFVLPAAAAVGVLLPFVELEIAVRDELDGGMDVVETAKTGVVAVRAWPTWPV